MRWRQNRIGGSLDDYLSKARHYLAQAAQLRALAALDDNTPTREGLLEVARAYDRLHEKYNSLAQSVIPKDAIVTSRECIDCNEEYQMAFWTNHFGVSPALLRDVIEIVGPRVSDVTAEIALRK